MNVVSEKLFSIIMPTYNRADMLHEAIESVVAQTYRPIELIIIDDGSTDSTPKVVETWAVQFNKGNKLTLRYFYQENAGPGAARNRGIQEICGAYVQFLDSDDRMHPERLRYLVGAFENNQCDFIQTGFEGFEPDTGKIINATFGRPGDDQFELALKGFLFANTLRSAFTAELVRRVGPWRTDMSCFEDREYVERAVAQAFKPEAISDVLASARRGGSARVSDKVASYEGRSWRIYCEECLAKAALNRKDISLEAKSNFASRIYALGFRCNASGWPDLAQRCGELAESMNVKLDSLGKRRKLIYQAGPWAARAYDWAHRAKVKLQDS